MMSPAGRVFDIQRFSLHDGPGIRTTVFLKGCPLRCLWCHNPEGIGFDPAVSFVPDRCLGCGECVTVCPNAAHQVGGGNDSPAHTYDRARCQVCGACAQACPARAVELVGRRVTVDEVMCQVLEDRIFYARSGGGLSLSGGEPLAQIDFAFALLQAARAEGLHCCVETSGFAAWSRFARLLPVVDLFLFDFKESDPRLHRDFTGRSNALILRNLRALDDAGVRIQLQCPIIPGCNERQDHFDAIAELALSLRHLAGVLLLPYHPLGKSKLARFGLLAAPALPDAPMRPEQLAPWITRLRQQGVCVLNPVDHA